MNCRVCGEKCEKEYTSVNLPECIWPTKKNFKSKCHVYSCLKCFHLQLQNFSKKKISEFYGDTQFNLSKSSVHKNRIRLIKKIYGLNYLKNKNILDVGGGINPILYGKQIFIADIKVQNNNKIIFKNNYFEIDIEKNSLPYKFECIFLIHSLEHFKYPLKALKNITKSLNPNGRLFIEVPNFDYYTIKKSYFGIYHQHLSMFTIEHLKNLLKQSGMHIDKLLIKNEIMFCSFKKQNIKKKVTYIDNKEIFVKYKKNYNVMRLKITKHIKNKKFNIYGGGGSMVLALASVLNNKKKINKIYDSDSRKWNKFFPGTKKKIFRNKKNITNINIYSLSSYHMKKNKNLNINDI